jgi:spore coat protein H
MRWWSLAWVASAFALGCGGDSDHDPAGGAGARAAAGGSGGSRPNSGGASGTAGKGNGRAGEGPAGSGGEGAETSTAGQGAGGGAGGATAGPRPGDVFFAEERVLDVRLTMSQANWQELEDHGNREQFVASAATLSGSDFPAVSFDAIGVRHKGSYSLHHCWDEFGGVRSHADECAKLSLKLKFDEYDSALRLDGLKRLNLHAVSGDETKLRDLMGYAIFREFGIDASRVMPARVYVNDRLLGLFMAVEEVDGRFTKAHFPEGADGNLYKEIWPSAEVSDDDFVAALETNEETADVSDMRDFAEAVAASSADDFLERMEPWIDLDRTLRYLVVDRALKNWDGITAFYSPVTPHNFFWYHEDSRDGRFHLIPWDLDNVLWEFDPFMHPEQWATAPPVPDWNSTPLDCSPRAVWEAGGETQVTPPRCDPFLDLLARTSWPRFVELGNQFLAGQFSLDRLTTRLEAHRARIAPIVALDPTLDLEAWQVAVADFSQILAQSIEDFRAFLAAGLIEELPPPPPELTDEELNVPSEDSGLHVMGMTNFEFAAPSAGVPAGVTSIGDDAASFLARWNDSSPISGDADLLFNFTFVRNPGTYDEWVNLNLRTVAEVDIRSLSRIMITLRTDVPRRVRIRLRSSVYDTVYGGIWSEFGEYYGASTVPRTVQINLHELEYPPWAKDTWTDGQGWPAGAAGDAEALDAVLRNFDGLIFGPSATTDPAGELTAAEETGFVAIDNIYFR